MHHGTIIDTAYSDYDDHRFQARNAYLTNPRRFAQVVRFIGEMPKVLDIGASHGDLAVRLGALGKEVDVLENSDLSAKECEKKGLKVYRLDIETDSFPDIGKFDVILMLEIVEHLLDPVNVLRRVAKLVSATGSVIISSPNAAYLKCRLQLFAGRVPSFGEDRSLAAEPRPYNLLHKTPLSIPNLVDCVEMAGLRVIAIEAEEYTGSALWTKPVFTQVRTILRNAWPSLLAGSVIVKARLSSTYSAL